MAPKSFPQFPLLPQEIQNDIWRRATNQAIDTPSVHYLEMFAIEPRHYGWQEMSRRVRRIQQGKPDDYRMLRSIHHNPFCEPDSFYPPVKLAVPLIFPDTRLSSGYYATGPRLAHVSWAAREEVTRAANARAKQDNIIEQLPRMHLDVGGNRPPVPLTINAEEDLVYLHQPITTPCVWNAMEYVTSSLMQSSQEHFQTMNIRRIMLSFDPGNYTRHCLGCHNLRYHYEQLFKLSVKRSQDRRTRARRGVKPACKMCRKVKEQVQLNPNVADEPIIRERLLKERMLAMLPEVRQRCAEMDYSLDLALRPAASEAAEDDDGDDDAVSICSADIDPDDDFAWYNNSRNLLVVNEIPYPAHILSGTTLPARFKQLYPPSIPSSPLPSLTRTQFHPPTPPTHSTPPASPITIQTPNITPHNNTKTNNTTNKKTNPNPHPIATPKHKTHPFCNTIAFTTPFDAILPSYFPRCSSVHLVDYSVKLRRGATTLPAQGRRWYTGRRDGVFVEVVDAEDGCWVWKSSGGDGDGGGDDSGQDDEVEDEVRVVEFVRWLTEWWKGFRYFDVERGENESRTVDVGFVAFLELDEEGRVRSE